MKIKINSCNKLIAALIIFVIMISEIILIPANAYAATDDLEKQGNNTNNRNVNFDAYFEGNQERKHSLEVTDESIAKLKFEINVSAGYLTNIQIFIKEPNFDMQTVENEIIKNIENNTITLNDINDGTILEIPLIMQKNDILKLEYLDKETTINMTATYVNDNGKNIDVKKELKVKLKWNLNTDFELTSNITNVLPYGDETLVQQKINLKEVERKSPIEQTKLSVTAPKINNILPSEIRVFANSTKATNGDEFGKNFGKNNYTYDQDTGSIEIIVNNNVNQNQEIAFYDSSDEYILTYVYEHNTTELLENKLQFGTYVKADIKLYSKVDIISKESANNYEITEQIGDNVTAEIYNTGTINKGFLYDNYNETGYNLNYKIHINNKDINNTINISTELPSFVANKNEFVTNQIYYKSMAVKEDLFSKVLGDNGYINIYDINNNLIATINKDTQKNSNGDLEVVYPCNQTNIRIEISKPQVEGVLELNNYKVIDAKLNYNISQTKEFYGIYEKVNIGKQYKGLLNLNETYTKVDLQMDNTELMPFVDNKVNLTLNLLTNSNEYDLFKNPEIRITLPEDIESINIGEISLVYNTELKFEYAHLEENGRVLVLKLTGEETNYKLGIQEGTKIIIPAVIRLKDTVTTKTSSIQLNYSNELAKATEYSLKEQNSIEESFNIVAKSGLITISKLSGYNGLESVSTIDDTTAIGQIKIAAPSTNATIETSIVNNYQTEMSEVIILGKIPFTNNVTSEGTDLGSNFNTFLSELLSINGISAKIYYSESEELTEDSDLWSENLADLRNIKAFKIVPDTNIPVGSELKFNYNIEIPADLKANLKSFATYTIKYNINEQRMQRIQTIGIETPNVLNNDINQKNAINMNVKLKVGDTELKENSEVHEQEIINYEIEVSNNSNNKIENISIQSPIPDGTVYVEKNDNPFEDGGGESTAGNYIGVYRELSEQKEVILDIGTLDVGESKTVEYEVKVKDLEGQEENATIVSNIFLKINNEEQITTTHNILAKKAKVRGEIAFIKRTSVLKTNEYTYEYRLYNLTNSDVDDLTTTIQIPKNVKVTNPKTISNGIGSSWDEEDTNTSIEINDNNLLTFKINKLKQGMVAQLEFLAEVTGLDNIDNSINISANTFLDNDTYRSNISKNIIKGAEILIENDSPTANQEVKAGDKITYNIKVTNKSNEIASQIYIVDELPKELMGESLEYNQFAYDWENNEYKEFDRNIDLSVTIEDDENSGTDTSKGEVKYDKENNKITIPTILPPGETINITLTTTVQDIEQDITLINFASAYGEYIIGNISNEVKHYAKKASEDKPVDSEEKTYSISGKIWLDTNENGTMDTQEDNIEGNEVILVNADTSEIVKDDNGAELKAVSTKDGYKLIGLKPGRYIVVFKYDSDIYKITKYKEEGVSELLNSKAIEGKATINGITEIVGMTDIIEITNNDINSINMGLIKIGNFDIEINKTINTVKTISPKGKEQDYKYSAGTSLGKIEVAAKNVDGTTVYVEYKIKIINNGDTKGYIEKIIDQIPDGLQFEQSLNKDWYEENGKLCNTTVDSLEAGQSKELSLVLIKNLNNDNLGIINNIATVNISNNNESKDGNLENNESNAQLIIGTSTGRIVLNVVVMLVLLTIIAIGLFIIKKYKNTK